MSMYLLSVLYGCGYRVDKTYKGFTVWAKDYDSADSLSRKLLADKCDGGKEGFEFVRALGLIQHVFALRFGETVIRIISPANHPKGLFSSLQSLEMEITV